VREALEQERAARAREEHLRLALETARMVTWEWSEARLPLVWSPNAEAFFGHPPGGLGDTLERFLERVLPGERTRVAEAFLQGLCAEGPYTFQFRAPWEDVRGGGADVPRGGRPTRMLGVVMDCTERELHRLSTGPAHSPGGPPPQPSSPPPLPPSPSTGPSSRLYFTESATRPAG